jgi:MtfA peptidase
MKRAARRWWRAARGDILPDRAWDQLCRRMALLSRYTDGERIRLRETVRQFLREKTCEGAGGLTVTDRIRRIVAAQACVPILELGMEWYRGWVSVVLYPATFLARQQYTDESGVVHELERPLIGESWDQGPVILALESVEESAFGKCEGNVVLHELAHKLDLLNGHANGMPPLHASMSRRAWTRAFSQAYDHLAGTINRGAEAPFDEYAVEDPGEFFAVMSEEFFLNPQLLLCHYPAVYGQLQAFYRQDPASRYQSPT